MAQTDFRAALQGSNELDITVTGEGIRYRLVQKPAQDPDHLPGDAWEDAHRERSFSH